MKMDEIIRFCGDVRTVLENMEKRDHSWKTSFYVSTFPSGCCGDTSKILNYLLHQQFGIAPEVISGKYHESEHEGIPCGLSNGNSHAWLMVNDHIIDLTADQFRDCGYNHPAVMITTDSAFHDLFSDRSAGLQPAPGQEDTLAPELMATASKIQDVLRERGWKRG
ncbi:hypothetical protein [Pantoea cypripedii]|uniref:Uncharacterized protein n=1 Tax=Pantoea cypripedii TaxID=55209 RepID=A0A6B9GCL8_PANCY|nr:hypothetical protein [Pantoea cypripedii]QGY33170.1 hypothetical protein CUN67_30115 [Pantoea cypripedii]